MNYHLNRDGQNLGIFPLEELQRRLAAGELTGRELVWTEGMSQWRPLDAILGRKTPEPIPATTPVVPPAGSNKALVIVLVVGAVLVLIGAVVAGMIGFQAARQAVAQVNHATESASTDSEPSAPATTFVESTAMEAASKPIVSASKITVKEATDANREFRLRQYVEGYKLRGERNPTTDTLALGLLSNWIACNYSGTVDTNLASLTALSDQLANDPACKDPLVLTAAAVNSVELHEMLRRLERAVKGFENSKHLGYPKLFATATLADKLIQDRKDRLPVLDEQSLQDLKEALTDGSITPDDQSQIAEILISGWGRGFFDRNGRATYKMVQGRGEAYAWLALTLQGEHEISEAWRARGGGYADTVSEAGMNGFNRHLAVARGCLTRAWNLKPNWPMAPCRMIYVSLGDAGIGEMRLWFDRTTAAQIDYARAYSDFRWDLRPRWYGDLDSMLAFGETALKTRRFDTDVPRVFFDSVTDVAQELNVSQGQNIYSRRDIWPHLQEMYEGYLANSSWNGYWRDGWRDAYATVAYLAQKYDVAREQLEAVHWQPHPGDLVNWGIDLSLMPLEVAARTGPQSNQVTIAEARHQSGNLNGALADYTALAAAPETETLTRAFARDRVVTLGLEKHLQAGEWADFLPTDTNFTGWHVAFGECTVLPDGALEVKSDQNGHLLYSRAEIGSECEVRGEFETVSSTTKAFQAGLVMGVPQMESWNWYAFRMKRNDDEGDVASFSQDWTKKQIVIPINLDPHTNSFSFRFHDWRVSATVDGRDVFKNVVPPKNVYVGTNEFLVGLGAFNDSNSTVVRYRHVQIRKVAEEK